MALENGRMAADQRGAPEAEYGATVDGVRPPKGELSILYRGPLSSCNYDCHYCPFAKHHETAAELRRDREQLARFCSWVEEQNERSIRILFTPWGEALIRRWYQEAMVCLSQLPHVAKVAIQTNLSCPLSWLADGRASRLALWCTWHPTESSRASFLEQTAKLDAMGIRYSVGVVGLKDYLDETELLRRDLPAEVYLWVNAFKDQADYYSDDEVRRWEAIDPLFRINNQRHASFGLPCRAGEEVISVDGNGDVRRCHFIKQPIGNIYDDAFDKALRRRACTNQTCGCHIGYVHLRPLRMERMFGDGILERIPSADIWSDDDRRRIAESLVRERTTAS